MNAFEQWARGHPHSFAKQYLKALGTSSGDWDTLPEHERDYLLNVIVYQPRSFETALANYRRMLGWAGEDKLPYYEELKAIHPL